MPSKNHVIVLLSCCTLSFRFDPQVVGGDSIFLDVFAVAERLRETHPEEFETLARVPATFQKIHFERYQ
jgi:gamma-butyrobetaine dioxygenase